MRVLAQENSFLMYQKIFSNVQANDCSLVIWQFSPNSGKRSINYSKLNSYYMDKKLLHFNLPKDTGLDQSLPLYCYSEDVQFIFKSNILDIRENVFSLSMPPEIKILEDIERNTIKGQMGLDLNADYLRVKRLNVFASNDVSPGYMKVKSMTQRSTRDQEFLNHEFGTISLDEEEKLFAGQRETPRARPKNEKWVRLKINDSENIYRLKLFDLSQGGMGFISFDTNIFPKSSKVYILGIDAHDLDDPLVGQVMSHRPIDDSQIEWKIGVKFDDGQN
jgi:c-di-GMP-binding flagellar brake protein YcgR